MFFRVFSGYSIRFGFSYSPSESGANQMQILAFEVIRGIIVI